ncbi:hypothetical protein D9M72_531750 [compost metagenome]
MQIFLCVLARQLRLLPIQALDLVFDGLDLNLVGLRHELALLVVVVSFADEAGRALGVEDLLAVVVRVLQRIGAVLDLVQLTGQALGGHLRRTLVAAASLGSAAAS